MSKAKDELKKQSEEKLHPDLRGHERANKSWFVFISYFLPVVAVLFFLYLFMAFGISVFTDLPVVCLLLVGTVFLPAFVKSGYEDDINVLLRATEVYEKEKPQKVFIDYVYKEKFIDPRLERRMYGPDLFFYYITYSDKRKTFQRTYQIYFIAPEMKNFTRALSIKDSVYKLEDQHKDRPEAKAYIDPDTNKPVLVELEDRRFWIIDLPPHH